MNKTWMAAALALLLACALALGAAETPEGGVTVTDMKGREIHLDAPATRIVALTASDCEILAALGCGDCLVGRGEYCDWPAEVLAVPAVQSGAGTNLEEIIALEPQVLLMSTMAQTEEQVQALEAAGIRVVVSDAQDIQGVYASIRLIGALMGKEAEAEALVAQMEGVFDQVAADSVNTGKTVYFEVSPLQWGLWTAGRGTFMDEMAAMCGLTNAFADVEGWGEISQEQVIERDPDFIVTIGMSYGDGPTPVEEIMARPGWENLKAVVNGTVFNASNDELTRPGPRLMDGVTSLFEFVQEHTDAAEEAPAA